MPARNGTYRITAAMAEYGAVAMDRCRREGGHTAHSVCREIFAAMLRGADVKINPRNLAKPFEWSPHDIKSESGGGKRRRGKLTREDFDEKGERVVYDNEGIAHKQYLQNFWYLKK